MNATVPFWEKPLESLDRGQWEALCDGCGRCCLIKLENEETGDIFTSDVHCKLLEPISCMCSDYEHRQAKVPDCIKLDPENVKSISWIPPSCAYRRIAEGKGLAWWHPLVSGDRDTVHLAGISARHRTRSEEGISPEQLDDYVIDWPGEDLRFVTITSRAALRAVSSEAEESITVTPSTHRKCDRCWHWRADVGRDAAHPTLCGRCLANLFGDGEPRTVA